MPEPITFEMSFEDHGGWHSLFVRGQHIAPQEFLDALSDPDRNTADDFDTELDVVEFKPSQVEHGWWLDRPVNEDDGCDFLEWIYEPSAEGVAGAYPVTYIAL